MRSGFNDRFIAVLVTVALVLAPLPAFPQEQRRAPRSGMLAESRQPAREDLFAGVVPDEKGHLERRVGVAESGEILYFAAPEGGDFRRRLSLDVPEGATELQVNVLGGGRFRLVDPAGNSIRPDRPPTQRYGGLVRLEELLQREARLPEGAQLGPARLLASQTNGTVADVAGVGQFVNLREPMAGRWTIVVTSRDAEGLRLSAMALGANGLQAIADSCSVERLPGCSFWLAVVIDVVEILVIAKLSLVLAAAAGATATAATVVTLAGPEIFVLLIKTGGDYLAETGAITKKTWKGLKMSAFIENWWLQTGWDLARSGPIAALLTAVSQVFKIGGFNDELAREICARLAGEQILAFVPTNFSNGVVGKEYKGQVELLGSDADEATIRHKGGKLPDGVQLTGKGEFFGKPLKEQLAVFKLRASLNLWRAVEATYSIAIFDESDGNKPDLVVFTLESDEEVRVGRDRDYA